QFSPTSPSTVASFRRPLPTPGAPNNVHAAAAIARSPLPTPGPTPGPSAVVKPPPALPVTSVSPPVPPILSPTSPATSPRRPLPVPLPRSPNGFFPDGSGARSPSPVRNPASPSHELPPISGNIPGSPTRFVPYWKRNLPAPNGSFADSPTASGPTPIPSSSRVTLDGADTTGTSAPPQLPQPPLPQLMRSRSRSVNGGRPLPPSPAQLPDINTLNLAGPSGSSRIVRDPSVPGPSSRARSPVKFKPTSSFASAPPAEPGPSKPPIAVASPKPSVPSKPFEPHVPSPPASDDDERKPKTRTPSPQYGIRDLPAKSRSQIDHNKARHARLPASSEDGAPDEPVRGRPSRSSTVPQPPAPPAGSGPISPVSPQRSTRHRPTQSVTLRTTAVFSPVPMPSARKAAGSTPSSPSAWPPGLPPLPRAPGSAFTKQYAVINNHREYVNLDDAPPPSLRRSPSPSAASPRINAPPHKPPSFRSPQVPPALPPRRETTSNPPSPKKSFATLPPAPSLPPAPARRAIPSTFGERFASASPERKAILASASPFVRAHTVATQAHGQQTFVQQRLDHRQVSPERKPQLTTSIPNITFSRNPDMDDLDDDLDDSDAPRIAVSGPDAPSLPQISIATTNPVPQPNRRRSEDSSTPPQSGGSSAGATNVNRTFPPPSSARRGGGMACGGCGGPIVGRIVSAMGVRWHPGCFRCCVCNDLLEYVSSYEHEGRPYCHLDYHELFAPRCYHCKTAIVDERFITLDDPELGQRTYHESHFFCSECGDPFLAQTLDRAGKGTGERKFTGDGEFGDDDVGFTVHRGYPYCEACHVRLRSPKCKKCKLSIRGGQQAVDALGGKWHWECFTCTSCQKPFEDPSFFLRENKPFCESCFSIIVKSEL
ncbi:hypothetical protein EVG20_g3197, partial [Dentipellis fragilis]